MRVFWISVAAIVSFWSTSHAQTVDWARVHETTVRGLDRLYNLDIDQALATFDTVRTLAPTDPRGHFFHCLTHFYLYGLNRQQSDLQQFFDESEQVIEVCERLVDQDERNASARFYLGGILGYRGIAHQTGGSLLKAVKDGREGYFLLEEAVHLDPQLYDAHMGFGLFRYLVAKVPRSMSWILSILGFSGDREGGLASLKLAADKGLYTRTEAGLFYAQFMFSEGRQDTALIYLEQLRARHPENTLFIVLYAAWQRQLNNLDEAQTAALHAIELNKIKGMRHGEELAYSTLGSIYYSKNEFSLARENYLLYMQKTQVKERTPNMTYFRAGLACEIAGDRAGAVELYRQMKEVDDSERQRERYQYRRAQELIRQPLSEPDMILIKAENEFSRKRYDRALALYGNAFQTAGGDARIRALYGIQQTYYELGRHADCIELCAELLALTPVSETWIIPYARFKKAQALEKLGRIPEALTELEAIQGYDEYDFQNGLERRTEEEIKRLRGEPTGG